MRDSLQAYVYWGKWKSVLLQGQRIKSNFSLASPPGPLSIRMERGRNAIKSPSLTRLERGI
jgi:hypothetical protein